MRTAAKDRNGTDRRWPTLTRSCRWPRIPSRPRPRLGR